MCKIKEEKNWLVGAIPRLEAQSRENNNNIIAKGRNSVRKKKMVIPEAILENIRSLHIKLTGGFKIVM